MAGEAPTFLPSTYATTFRACCNEDDVRLLQSGQRIRSLHSEGLSSRLVQSVWTSVEVTTSDGDGVVLDVCFLRTLHCLRFFMLLALSAGLYSCVFLARGRLCVVDIDFFAWYFPALGFGIRRPSFHLKAARAVRDEPEVRSKATIVGGGGAGSGKRR